jgi:DnaK suppressor protein
MLSNEDLNLVRQILESALKEATPTRELRDSVRIHQVADPLDMTQQAAEREMSMQSLDRESALVRRLRTAIGRIDGGSYGVCLLCEEDIAPKRLKAMPWAELCIYCQVMADQPGLNGEIGEIGQQHVKAA